MDSTTPLRLHLGGEAPRDGWKILNIAPLPHVDFVGDVVDLSRFGDGTVTAVYASHIFEHLSKSEFVTALEEVYRVLVPDGQLMLGVPDLQLLCSLYARTDLSLEARVYITHLIYGGQTNPYDFHKFGYDFSIINLALREIGFRTIERVPSFGLFNDCTEIQVNGQPLSLNVLARK
jgi:predicted SAM-dependent methyltransferase